MGLTNNEIIMMFDICENIVEIKGLLRILQKMYFFSGYRVISENKSGKSEEYSTSRIILTLHEYNLERCNVDKKYEFGIYSSSDNSRKTPTRYFNEYSGN